MNSSVQIKNREKALQWISLGLCIAVIEAKILEQVLHIRTSIANTFVASEWFLPVAAVFVVLLIIMLNGRSEWIKLHRGLCWIALILVLLIANRLPFDFLTMAGLLGDPATGHAASVDWPGMATRILALLALITLARLTLSHPSGNMSGQTARWYGYAGFILALPYPFIRIIWAFGGTLGLEHAGDGGVGFSPLLFAIPWVLAAILSLLLVKPPLWMPRKLLLVAGWTATAIVGTLGPLAVWTIITQIVTHKINNIPGMALWVPCLFYGSWFLWAIAAGAATRSYQLRSAAAKVISK